MTQEGDKEDKLEFTPEGETPGYISLDQARVLVIEHAREHTSFTEGGMLVEPWCQSDISL